MTDSEDEGGQDASSSGRRTGDGGTRDSGTEGMGNRRRRWARREQPIAQREHSSPKEEAEPEEEAWRVVDKKNRNIIPSLLNEMTELDRKAKNQKEIRFFKAIVPEGLNAVSNGGWEEVTMYLDSGATETVIPAEMLMSLDLKEGAATRQGITYEVANGVRIANLGEKAFIGVTEDGQEKEINAQVCEVNKALLSVSKAVKAGNTVVFDEDGSYIESKLTGQRTWLTDEGGTYASKMFVKTLL